MSYESHMLDRVEPPQHFKAPSNSQTEGWTCSGPGSCGLPILPGEVVIEIRDGEFEHERCVEEVGDGE